MRSKSILTAKRVIIIVLCLAILSVVGYSLWRLFRPHYGEIELKGFSSSDARLGYDGYVVTSKNGHLCLVNTLNGETKEVFVRSNWVDAMTTDNIIVYSNTNSKTGICHFDPSDASILDNEEIINDGLFRIDPSIVKLNDTYFLTTTVIVGPINLADVNNYHGYYQIQLHKSNDLTNWEYVTDIYAGYENLEDVELDAEGTNLRILFEQETVDRGPSKILTMVSEDYGQNWSEPIPLVDNGADNEPASFLKTMGEYWLFYSSDVESPGGSYQSSEAYLLRLNNQFEPVETVKLNLKYQNQILLYQAIIENNQVTYLYAHDYLGQDDLVLENLPLDSIVRKDSQ